MAEKLWKLLNDRNPEAEKLADELGISNLLGRLLINRGINNLEKARDFLNPELSKLHDPFLLSGMKEAIQRIATAIESQEQVLIYGDYDVDGISSVALLVRVLAKFLPGKMFYYLPKRLEEGYGLHQSSLEKALARGTTLIITVDCGISAFHEAEYLKSKGVDLIITDHHEPPAVLPEAYAIINPKLSEREYPFTQLAGVGVAFKLLQGLTTLYPEMKERLMRNLDLVAFGTVADIVPLMDENRILVKYGLEQLSRTENIGMQALLQIVGLKDKKISCGQIGFVLAPRINAAGRMGNPTIGVKLFLTNDPIQVAEFAKELEAANQARQETENFVLHEVQAQLMANPSFLEEHALVLAGEGWHLGVIGIVASRLVDLYNRPVILISFDGEEGRGSGRSIFGFNLFNAIENCGQYLLRYGGHEFAAGLSVSREQFEVFRENFLKLAKDKLTKEDLIPSLKIEEIIQLEKVTLELTQELNCLAPCGSANPTPIFGCRALNLVDYRNVGENGKHLKLRVREREVIREGIGFNLGFINQELAVASEIDLAFSLEENYWNGLSQVQLNLKDVKPRGSEEIG